MTIDPKLLINEIILLLTIISLHISIVRKTDAKPIYFT
jgi:hypothetical protein